MALLFEEKKGIRVKQPKWISRSLWKTLSGLMNEGMLECDIQFSKAERKRLRKRKQIPPSKWAELYRVLVKSRYPGAWKNDLTPYLVGIMDTAALPYVREMVICKAPQTGVSEAIMNFIGSRVDLAPGDVLYTFPDQKLTNENFEDRLHDMFRKSMRLRSYLTGNKKDLTNDRIKLQHMTIYGAWASSVATLSNKPIRYAISDEIDKAGFGSSKAEASPLALIDKRLITFYEISKHIKISSPSIDSGNVWIELNECEVIFDYHAKCPFCDGMQHMSMERIKWLGGSKADRKKILKEKSAWYECEHCGEKWDDHMRDVAVLRGDWLDRETGISINTYCEKYRPASVGFHLPGWLSHFVSLSKCAGSFLKSLNSKENLKDHRNGIEALPWEEKTTLVKKEDEEVLKCKINLPPQLVPANAVALTAFFDMQKVGYPYVIRAWARDYTRWLIDYGMVHSFEEIEKILFEKSYPIENSKDRMVVWRAGLDTGGGKYKKDISSTEEAYLWLQEMQRKSNYLGRCPVFGTKGSSNPMPNKIKMGSVLNKTPTGKALKYGLRLVILDPDKMKDIVYEGMEKALDGETGGAYLHEETTLEYAKQITAEVKEENEKGVITWNRKRVANHYFDCEAGAAALANWEWPGGGVNLFPDPELIRPSKAGDEEEENPYTGGEDYWG